MKILQLGTGKVLWEGADLYGANLRGANLYGADLRGANLRGANLRDADLRGANLYGADLSSADLSSADLSSANLYGADLRGADLYGANLDRANLNRANLRDANLNRANLYGANLPEFQIPQEGSLVVWKKLENGLAKLRIPEDAKRTMSLVGRKCRAEYAEVLELIGCTVGVSRFNDSFSYVVGTIVRPDKYDPDIRIECSFGIHFFLTREEAENY